MSDGSTDAFDWVEVFRKALMRAHSHDWDMETVSEAAHVCAREVAAQMELVGVAAGARVVADRFPLGKQPRPVTTRLSLASAWRPVGRGTQRRTSR